MFVFPVVVGVVVSSVPASVTMGGYRCAMMGAGGQPTSADAGDPVTQGVATDAMREAPVHQGRHMVMVMDGHRFAAIPATPSAINPAFKCKESLVILVETRFSFPWVVIFMISIGL